MRTIQTRLTLAITLGVILLLGMAGIILDRYLATQLQQQFDDNLLTKAMTLVTLTTQEDGMVEIGFADEFMPEFEAKKNSEYFQLWLRDGALIERSHSLGIHNLPELQSALNQPVFSDLVLIDGRPGRAVEVIFIPHLKDHGFPGEELSQNNESATKTVGWSLSIQARIVVAKGRESLGVYIGALRSILFITFISLVIIIAVFTWFTTRFGLRSLRDVSQQLIGLNATQLNQRFVLHKGGDELQPIVNQINFLMERLEQDFQREKRFSDNVAHEFRTPLAELRALSEVVRQWPTESLSADELASEVLSITSEMEVIVQNLLLLARCDAGSIVIGHDVVELHDLIDNLWLHYSVQASERNIELVNNIRNDMLVNTDKDKFELIVKNILSNASAYSRMNTRIFVSTKCIDEQLVFTVTNDTDGLLQDDLPLLFERFWRKDLVRTSEHHAGLGLALVKSLAELLQFEVSTYLINQRFQISLTGLDTNT